MASLRAEQLLTAILESTEEALLGIALDGTIQSWSRGAERVYGYTAAEIINQPLARLLPVYETAANEKVLDSEREEGIPVCSQRDRLHKDGSILQVAVKHTPLKDEQSNLSGVLESGRVLHG